MAQNTVLSGVSKTPTRGRGRGWGWGRGVSFFPFFFLAIYLGRDSFLVEKGSVGVQREMFFL